jgi:hypothetical protein
MPPDRQRQPALLPENPRRPDRPADRLRRGPKVRPDRNQIRPRFAVSEDHVLVGVIDLPQFGQETPEVDFRATHSSWNQAQRVDADAKSRHLVARGADPWSAIFTHFRGPWVRATHVTATCAGAPPLAGVRRGRTGSAD